jgi:hypothetical protein
MVKVAATLFMWTLLGSAPLSSAAVVGRDTAIRDLRGIFAPSALPPFAVTAALLLLFFFLMWLRRRGSVKCPPLSLGEQATNYQYEMLLLLMEEWRLRQIEMSEVIERLALIVQGFLNERIGIAGHHLTSEEIIAALTNVSDEEFLKQAGSMLLFFDKVRFGGIIPTAEQTECAAVEALQLIQVSPGKRYDLP